MGRSPAARFVVACLAAVAMLNLPTMDGALALHDQRTARASVKGEPGVETDRPSDSPAISADGRYVAFASDGEFGTGTNDVRSIWIRDRVERKTYLVPPVTSDKNKPTGPSDAPVISGDGRYVAWSSVADNFVTGDTNEVGDIFVHDRQELVTTVVSVSSSEALADGASHTPSMSPDGRYIAFRSDATNLVTLDTNDESDIFVRDTQTGETTRVSVGPAGAQANGASLSPSISADGRYVAFSSAASNLVLGDLNNATDVFVHDRQMGLTSRVSAGLLGLDAHGESLGPAMSSDGRYVAYTSDAPDIVLGDTNLAADEFLYDRQMRQTTRVSVGAGGAQANGPSGGAAPDSTGPTVSPDGRFVTFTSEATNLVPGDTNDSGDIFVRDRQAGTTTRVSVRVASLAEGDGPSDDAVISSDGRYVAFASDATNLVPNDGNEVRDVFTYDQGEEAPPVATSFEADPAAINPDSGPRQTKLSWTLADDSPPVDWMIEIKDPDGVTVLTLGSGQFSTSPDGDTKTWRGEDSTGETVPDGEYTAVLTATDHWGNQSQSSIPITVDAG